MITPETGEGQSNELANAVDWRASSIADWGTSKLCSFCSAGISGVRPAVSLQPKPVVDQGPLHLLAEDPEQRLSGLDLLAVLVGVELFDEAIGAQRNLAE